MHRGLSWHRTYGLRVWCWALRLGLAEPSDKAVVVVLGGGGGGGGGGSGGGGGGGGRSVGLPLMKRRSCDIFNKRFVNFACICMCNNIHMYIYILYTYIDILPTNVGLHDMC